MLQIGFTPAHLHIIFIISVIALVPFPATTAAAACVKINDTLSFIANTTIVVSSNSTTYLLDSCTEPIRFEADCSTTTASVTVSNITIIVEGSKTSALPTVAVSCSPVDHAPNWDALRIALRNLNTNLTSNGTAILDTASTKSVLTNSMLTIEDSWISVGWNGTGLAPWFLNVANTPSNTNDFSGTNLTFAIRNCTLHLRNMKFMFFKTLSTVVMRSISVVMEGVHMRIWMDRIVEFGNRIGMFSFDNNFAVSEFDLRFTNIQVSTVVNIGAMNFSVILTQEISWSLLYFHIWGENSSELNFIVTNSTFNISQEFSNSATLQSVLPSVEIDDVVCLLVAVMYVDTPPTRVAVKLSALHVNVTNTFLLGNASSSVQLMYVSGDGTSEVNTTVLDDIRIVVRNVSMIAERSGVLPLNTTITRCNVLAFEKSSLYGALIVVQDVEAHCYMEIGDKKRQHYPGVTTFGFVGWITRSQLLYMHNCLLQDFNASIVSSQLTVENIQGGFITLGFTQGAGILTFFDIAAFSFVVAVRCSILLEGSKLTAAVEIPVASNLPNLLRDLLFPSNIAQVAAMTFAGTVTNSSVELRESTSVVVPKFNISSTLRFISMICGVQLNLPKVLADALGLPSSAVWSAASVFIPSTITIAVDRTNVLVPNSILSNQSIIVAMIGLPTNATRQTNISVTSAEGGEARDSLSCSSPAAVPVSPIMVGVDSSTFTEKSRISVSGSFSCAPSLVSSVNISSGSISFLASSQFIVHTVVAILSTTFRFIPPSNSLV